eukprot:jgi/Antlo1/778/1428
MKVRLKNKEHLCAVFSELRSRVGAMSNEDERVFAMFRRIVTENVEFSEGDAEAQAYAEQEEVREQKMVAVAFRRIELVRELCREYEESCRELRREVECITKALGQEDLFSLRAREWEGLAYSSLESQVRALAERVPETLERMGRARRVLEDESRKSIGANAAADSPLRMYFDLR